MCREYSLKGNLIVASVRPDMWPAGGEPRTADDIDCCIATDDGRPSAVISSRFKDLHTYLVCAEKKILSVGCRSSGLEFPLARGFHSKFSRLTSTFVPMDLTKCIAEPVNA
jgi:hypothetical protein